MTIETIEYRVFIKDKITSSLSFNLTTKFERESFRLDSNPELEKKNSLQLNLCRLIVQENRCLKLTESWVRIPPHQFLRTWWPNMLDNLSKIITDLCRLDCWLDSSTRTVKQCNIVLKFESSYHVKTKDKNSPLVCVKAIAQHVGK